MQGGGGEDVLAARRLDIDRRQGLIAQTVPVLQQDQVVGLQHSLRDRPGARQRMADRGGGQNLVVADMGVVDPRRVIRQGDDGGVQLARLQPGDQARRQVFADEQAQARILGLQPRQGARQQEGRHGRDDPQPETARQRLASVLGGLDQILGAGQHILGPAHGLGADGGQDHGPARTLDHRGPQHPLQLLHPRRQGGLADVGRLGRATERAVLGQEFEVLELTQRRQDRHGLRISRAGRLSSAKI